MATAQELETNTVVPPAVKRNADRVAALVAEQAAKKASLQAAPKPAPVPITVAPPVPAPITPTTPTAHTAPEVTSTSRVQETNEYLSMKGRFDAEQRNANALRTRLAEVERLFATMQAAPSQPEPTAPQARLITPVEETEYGAEMIDVIGRRAKEVLSPEVQTLKAEIEGLKRQIGGVSNVIVQDARQKMFADLDAALPSWRVQNNDQNFISWLGLPDEYSGAIRHSLLTQAFAQNQTSRVLAFFKGFLANEATPRPAGTASEISGAEAPKVSLESLAAPGRARQTGGTPPPAEKPVITRAQIRDFYRAVNQGAYAGRDAEKLAIEKAILQASAEGRIQ